ncbi:MAG: hypothetical protein QM755_01560 [Luteolibacter sp.]
MIALILLWQTFTSRRAAAVQIPSGQLDDIQNRVQAVEKLLREVG